MSVPRSIEVCLRGAGAGGTAAAATAADGTVGMTTGPAARRDASISEGEAGARLLALMA